MKVFLDCDVIIDFLIDREPYIEDITEILQLSLNSPLQLSVSPITITNSNYIIGKIIGKSKAIYKIEKILELVKVESVGEATIYSSIESNFKDFEDGVQNFCAEESNHSIIVTRNVKDFKESNLAILTPKEFLVEIK